jgi:hypothetical protein
MFSVQTNKRQTASKKKKTMDQAIKQQLKKAGEARIILSTKLSTTNYPNQSSSL